MSYIIGFFILAVVVTYFKKILQILLGIIFLSLGLVVVFAYPWASISFISVLIALGIVANFFIEKSLDKKIKESFKSSGFSGIVDFYSKCNRDEKYRTIKYLDKKNIGERNVKILYFRDFYDFAINNSDKKLVLVDSDEFTKYANSLWVKIFPSFNTNLILSEWTQYFPDWKISEQSVYEQGTKNKVRLIRLEKFTFNSEALVIDLDED